MIPVPLGPISAFDVNEAETIIFDELHNKLVLLNGDSEIQLSIPKEYSRELFYWARLHFVTRNVLLCLLKSHSNKVYYFVTLKIDREAASSTKLNCLKSHIYSTGYRIESHQAGSQFVFSMNNTEKKPKHNYKPQISDREMFNKQVQEQFDYMKISESSPTSPTEAVENTDSMSLKSIDFYQRSNQNIREGVVVVVHCTAAGGIQASIVSLGKQRLGVKLRRVGSIRKLKDTIGTKFMTKWDCDRDEILCEPVLSGSRALLLCRNDPSLCCIMDTVVNPRHGLGAAIQQKISSGLSRSSVPYEPTRVTISSLPPDPSHLWSNIEVLNGSPLLVTVAPTTGYCLVFVLNQLSGSIPRLFWKRHELSLSLATPSLKSLFVRAKKDSHSSLCSLTIRALVNNEKEMTKSFIENVEFRL